MRFPPWATDLKGVSRRRREPCWVRSAPTRWSGDSRPQKIGGSRIISMVASTPQLRFAQQLPTAQGLWGASVVSIHRGDLRWCGIGALQALLIGSSTPKIVVRAAVQAPKIGDGGKTEVSGSWRRPTGLCSDRLLSDEFLEQSVDCVH